jgi:signal peptide peptidase SppA
MLHQPVRTSFERALLEKMDLVPASEPDDDEPQEPQQPQTYRESRIYNAIGNTAVIQIVGVLDKYVSLFDLQCYGGCDLDDVDHAIALARNDAAIEKVVLFINTPGGGASGVAETAERIADLRSVKEVYARVDVMACSGGYYIASQADRIDASESAYFGSIGVYCAILDATRALEINGYKMELITAGKFKAMGSPFKPMSAEERALFQANVLDIRDKFRADVRGGRRAAGAKVSDETMEGQFFRGQKAVDAGLADEIITATLDEYVGAVLTDQI